jgi:hypothetical protein
MKGHHVACLMNGHQQRGDVTETHQDLGVPANNRKV